MQRNRASKIAFWTAALLLALGLACSDEDGDASVKAPEGVVDELRLALDSEPETLDPHLAFISGDWSILKQIHRGLFWYDEDLNLVPMLAKELPTTKNAGISSDGLLYRIRLRDGIKWSDGQELTANDFEYSFKRLLDPALEAPFSTSFYDVTGAEDYNSCFDCSEEELTRLRDDVGIKAEDASTLVFTLRTPRAAFPYLLTTVASSPVRDDIVGLEDAWGDPERLVSSGPFVLSRWDAGSEIVLEANANWWGDAPRLKRVTIKIIPEASDALNAYLADEIDATVLTAGLQPTVDADPILRKQNQQVGVFASLAYFFNHAQPPFDDLEVRQAISMAFDRQAFVRDSQASARPGYSWLPPGMPGHDEKLGEDWKFDPEKAKDALKRAGHEGGKDLASIRFGYPGENSRAKAAAEFLQAQLQVNLNLRIDLVPMPRDQWRQQLGKGELQLLITGFASEYADPDGFLGELWRCQRYEGKTCTAFYGGNFSHYANPAFDQLMQQAAKETDKKRRTSLYAKAEKILVEDAAALFIGYETRSLLVKPYVREGANTPLDWLPFELFLDRVYLND